MPISESSNPACSLVCVGSELLRGKINTHASTLARRLASIGMDLEAECTVGDDFVPLMRRIEQALSQSAVVIVTGGLGPTFDDITREAAARACGFPLVRSANLMKEIRAKFRRARYRKMPPANMRQADLLEGAQAIPNRVGTAPGQWLEIKSDGQGRQPAPPTILILLPGPPVELHPMLDGYVIPRLRRVFPRRPAAEAHLHFVGVPESRVDHLLRPIIEREKDVRFTILAHLGLVDFDIFVSADNQHQAITRLNRIVKKIQRKMGHAFYGRDLQYPLEKVVGDLFVQNRATLSVAESCTGGWLAKTLTDIPGSSRYLLGGVVSYDNRIKESFLSVGDMLLKKFGAVSTQVAQSMAQGIRTRTQSDWGLSITGIAGPGGATPSKPVGLVYIGLAGPRGARVHAFHFQGTREAIRQRTVIAALDLLRLIYI